MRREHLTLEVTNVDWVESDEDPRRPTVSIDVSEDAASVKERLRRDGGDYLEASEVDVALRLQESLEEDAVGVLGVTNRMTGEYILELNVGAAGIVEFVRAARRYGEVADDEEGRYTVEIRLEGNPLVHYEKRTFLVYDEEGGLLRQHSLIPSGVEL